MKFIDLQAQYQREKEAIDHAIDNVLAHGQFVLGPEVSTLEKRLAAYVGVTHCIAMSSGTVTLQAALMALGIGPGDEVIVPALSFIATASMVVLVGATPVFVDIDPDTYNINPTLIEEAITDKTQAIIPVDLYGQMADYESIEMIAEQYGLKIIADAAQAFGASQNGRMAASVGDIGSVSFYPAKPLGAYGEGGACFTNDDVLADRLRKIRHQGQDGTYNHVLLGLNARLSTMQAAILLAKLDCYDDEFKQRQVIAGWYDAKLSSCVKIPKILSGNVSSYAQYTIEVGDRNAFRAALNDAEIPTAVHYPKTLYQQPCLSERGFSGNCPVAEAAVERVVSLPFYPDMTQSLVDSVSEQVKHSVSFSV